MSKVTSADVSAESKRAALLAIAASNDGRLLPEAIVNAASALDSPLHDEFDWNDEEAAAKYRLVQAGALVRRLRITIVRENSATKTLQVHTTRAFQSRPSQRSRDGGYESVQDILSDADKRTEMIAQVLAEMNAYRKRYADLVELSEIWNAVDTVLALHERPARGRNKPKGKETPAHP